MSLHNRFQCVANESPTHGAFVRTHCKAGVAAAIWQSTQKRGGYTRLETPQRAARRAHIHLDPDEEDAEELGNGVKVVGGPCGVLRLL